MFWNASSLMGYRIEASDGAVGSVGDFLFDDRDWTIRWLVVDIGMLAPRSVLLPTSAIRSPSAAEHVLRVDATREQVKDSPEIDMHAPVSRQDETGLYGYYGWSPYWAGYLYAPAGGIAAPVPAHDLPKHRPETEHRDDDPNLRSMNEVTGYYIHASDGDIGHVEDLLIDSETWSVRYVVVDTKNWWPGRKVIVTPGHITAVNWSDGSISADLTREQVRNAPEYDLQQTLDRAYEEQYHEYYRIPYYWARPPVV